MGLMTGMRSRMKSLIRAAMATPTVDSKRPILIMGALIGACVVTYVVFLVAAGLLQFRDPREVDVDVRRVATRSDTFVGNRGTIFDSTGHRAVAVTVSDMSVKWDGGGADNDFMRVANGLATVLDMDPLAVFWMLLTNIGDGVVVKHHISEDEEEQIRMQNIPGVSIISEQRRFYPLDVVMGSVLGYLNEEKEKKGQLIGRLGVEKSYHEVLSPRKRSVRNGRTSNIVSKPDDAPGEAWQLDGSDIDLTIDARLQIVLDNALFGAMVRERASGGMAVMMDARTFDVLAMSSYPFLDPNRFQDVCAPGANKIDDGSSACVNKVLTYRYEPGSVAKTISLAAALESGIKLTDTFNAHGGVCDVGGHQVHDEIRRSGYITLADAIKFSSNCTVQEMAKKLDPKYLQDVFARFGLGQSTGIDLPDIKETYNTTPWKKVAARSAAYGYGFYATQINLATAYTTITNNGIRLAPRVVKRIRRPDGTIEEVGRPEGIPVVSSDTAADVRKALRRVVMDDDGTGKRARPTLYTAGGKTGTARVAGTTKEDKAWNCSFVGFAPAENPKIVIAITIIRPQVNFGGGTSAGPVFAEAVDNALPILGIEPMFKPEPRPAVKPVSNAVEGEQAHVPN